MSYLKTFLENKKMADFLMGFFLKKVLIKSTYTKKSRSTIGQLVWSTAVGEIETFSGFDIYSPIEVFM